MAVGVDDLLAGEDPIGDHEILDQSIKTVHCTHHPPSLRLPRFRSMRPRPILVSPRAFVVARSRPCDFKRVSLAVRKFQDTRARCLFGRWYRHGQSHPRAALERAEHAQAAST